MVAWVSEVRASDGVPGKRRYCPCGFRPKALVRQRDLPGRSMGISSKIASYEAPCLVFLSGMDSCDSRSTNIFELAALAPLRFQERSQQVISGGLDGYGRTDSARRFLCPFYGNVVSW